jgi:hypothetical protein
MDTTAVEVAALVESVSHPQAPKQVMAALVSSQEATAETLRPAIMPERAGTVQQGPLIPAEGGVQGEVFLLAMLVTPVALASSS